MGKEIVTPRFQGIDDGKEFLIIDVVVSFSRGKGLEQVETRVPIAVCVGLEKDSTRSILGGISSNHKGGGKVREV